MAKIPKVAKVQAYADNNGLLPDRVEVRFTVSREEWEQVQACAAFDKNEPMEWLKRAGLSWIEETLEAIRQESWTPEQIEAEDSRAEMVGAFFRRSLVASEIGLSPDEMEAVRICAAWEGWGDSFCRKAIIALLEAVFGEMQSCAEGWHSYPRSEEAKLWAVRHYKLAAPIMRKIGWDGNQLKGEAA